MLHLKVFTKSHDRFLIIDDKVYHVGASIKDLGKKWFAILEMEDQNPNDLISKALAGRETEVIEN